MTASTASVPLLSRRPRTSDICLLAVGILALVNSWFPWWGASYSAVELSGGTSTDVSASIWVNAWDQVNPAPTGLDGSSFWIGGFGSGVEVFKPLVNAVAGWAMILIFIACLVLFLHALGGYPAGRIGVYLVGAVAGVISGILLVVVGTHFPKNLGAALNTSIDIGFYLGWLLALALVITSVFLIRIGGVERLAAQAAQPPSPSQPGAIPPPG